MDLTDNDQSLQELEELFKELETEGTGPQSTTEPPEAQPASKVTPENIETTKAFSKRLKEKTEKAVAEERERLAKELGYESYQKLQETREKKMLEDKGLDPDEVSPIVDELVNKRLNDDPRMKELEALRQKQLNEFATKELQELKDLTNGEITNMEQVPKDVIELWKSTGSLKKAYMSLHGEELVRKVKNFARQGDTSHLANLTGTPPPPIVTTRNLTDKEKHVWRIFYPGISEDELNKKQVNY